MFAHVFTAIILISSILGKPIVFRNVSDCSITEDGILYYSGKHSFTKFEHECLPWSDLQTVFTDIITEPNFFTDASIKAAKNYCRNPNMNVNGPWCYIEDEEAVVMEQCHVCQSLIRTTQPTESIDIDNSEHTTELPPRKDFFQNLRDDMKRYGIYIREKFLEIVERIKTKFNQLGTKISNHFNG